MPLINLDFDLADVSSERVVLPAESYICRIQDVELVTSSTQKAMLKIVWEVGEGEFKGHKLYDNVLLSTDWKIKQYCELAGIESGTTFDSNDFKGCEAILSIKVGEYQGKPNNNIDAIEPV